MDGAGPSRLRTASGDKMLQSYRRSSAYADDVSSPTTYTDDDSGYYRHGNRSGSGSEAAQSTKASSPVDRMSPFPSIHGKSDTAESPSSGRPPFSLYDLPDPSTFKEPGLSFMTTSTAESGSGRHSDYLGDFAEDAAATQQGSHVRIRQASGGTPVESESDVLEGYQDLTLGRSGNVLARRVTGGETARSRKAAEKANIRGLAPAPYSTLNTSPVPLSPESVSAPQSARPQITTHGSYQQTIAEKHLQRSRRDISGPLGGAVGEATSPKSPESRTPYGNRMRSDTVSTTASTSSFVSIAASSEAERFRADIPRSHSQDVYLQDSHRQPSWLDRDPAYSEQSYGRASTPSVSGSQPNSRSNSLRYSRKQAHRMDVYHGYQTVDESFASDAEANAIMLVEDGRSSIVDMERIARWGGVDSLKKRLESEIGGDIDGGVIEDFTGATHVLLPSMSLSDDIYGLLSALLPIISSTVVVLDVSNCFLDAVPESLVRCKCLEELNISDNPLAMLPSWLGQLSSLRVLVVDACGLKTLPADLVAAHHLHTICARRNRLISLPSWLSQLPRLRTLLIDENPFAGQWKDLVKNIASPAAAAERSVNQQPLQSASRSSPNAAYRGQQLYSSTGSGFDTPAYTASGPPSAESLASQLEADQSQTAGDAEADSSFTGATSSTPALQGGSFSNQTVTPDHFVPLAISPSASSTFHTDRTASMFTDTTETPGYSAASRAPSRLETSQHDTADINGGSKVVRRMRSAGTLLGFRSNTPTDPTFSLGNMRSDGEDDELKPPRPGFATFNGRTRSRAGTSLSNYKDVGIGEAENARSTSVAGNYQPRSISASTVPAPSTQNKGGKWGFLKKMSMSRMRANGVGSNHASRPAAPVHTKSDSTTGPDSGHLARPAMAPPAHSTPAVPTLSTKPGGPAATREQPYGTIGRGDYTGRQHMRLQNNLPTVQASPPHPSQQVRIKRQSFLPIWDGAPALNIAIPSTSPFMASNAVLSSDNGHDSAPVRSEQGDATAVETLQDSHLADRPLPALPSNAVPYDVGLRSIMSYLRDLYDLSLPIPTAIGGAEVVASDVPATGSTSGGSDARADSPSPAGAPPSRYNTIVAGRRARRPTALSDSTSDSQRRPSEPSQPPSESRTSSVAPSVSGASSRPSSIPKEVDEDGLPSAKKYKDDAAKRAGVVRHIVETERTYVQGLKELVDIYVSPSSSIVSSKTGETLIPASERKIVFGGIEGILRFHQTSFLPDLEKAARTLLSKGDDAGGDVSKAAANSVGQVFRLYNPFMRQYSAYINNFDFALQRLRNWTSHGTPGASSPTSVGGSPTVGGTQGIQSSLVGVGLGMSAMTPPPTPDGINSLLTSTQRKRVRTFLQTCRQHPRHSQINLESYLLLPVQRIPRYRLLVSHGHVYLANKKLKFHALQLEDLARSTPPIVGNSIDVLEDALQEMTALASSMNEEKRDSESRRRLVKWQSRIRGKFATPLVQAHRRLLLDGHLTLSRVVKRNNVFVEVSSHVLPGSAPPSAPTSPFGSSRQLYGEHNSDADHTITAQKAIVQIEALTPEISNRKVAVILTSDLLILCKDVMPASSSGLESGTFAASSSAGEGPVDLYAVLRLQTKKRPASLVRGSEIRLVDNKSILYFTAGSSKEAVEWVRTINTEFDPMR